MLIISTDTKIHVRMIITHRKHLSLCHVLGILNPLEDHTPFKTIQNDSGLEIMKSCILKKRIRKVLFYISRMWCRNTHKHTPYLALNPGGSNAGQVNCFVFTRVQLHNNGICIHNLHHLHNGKQNKTFMRSERRVKEVTLTTWSTACCHRNHLDI